MMMRYNNNYSKSYNVVSDSESDEEELEYTLGKDLEE